MADLYTLKSRLQELLQEAAQLQKQTPTNETSKQLEIKKQQIAELMERTKRLRNQTGVSQSNTAQPHTQAITPHAQALTPHSQPHTPHSQNPPQPAQNPLALNQDQLSAIKAQFEALAALNNSHSPSPAVKNLVVDHIETSTSNANDANPLLRTIVHAAYNHSTASFSSKSSQLLVDSTSNPFSLAGPSLTEKSNFIHIPATLPPAIDPHQLQLERERRIHARISHRIKSLEAMNLDISAIILESDSPVKSDRMKAAIELKALKLAEKQKLLRLEIVKVMQKGTTLATATNKAAYKRLKKHTLENTMRLVKTDSDFRKTREDRERTKHREYLKSITSHALEFSVHFNNRAASAVKMGVSVSKIHAKLEKEDQLRAQKLQQDRLNALKANDEEAYLKLVGKAKNSRIHHILNQTKTFLEKLTGAVQSQKETIAVNDPDVEDASVPNDKDEYYNTAHKLKEKVTQQPTMLVGGQLKEYQIQGLEWMVSLHNNKLNGILADEMGLGKTIQTISLITYLLEKKRVTQPFLVVVPLSTLSNWVHEFEKWAPSVNKIVFKGAPAERKRIAEKIRAGGFNVLLTTFEYIIREKGVLSKPTWAQLIIDEGHRMKNSNSKLSVTLIQYYKCPYRLILTGTPLQ
ncbi:hypothetical protein HK096_007010, partial [Nowakowskiella sp. JEL0078]